MFVWSESTAVPIDLLTRERVTDHTLAAKDDRSNYRLRRKLASSLDDPCAVIGFNRLSRFRSGETIVTNSYSLQNYIGLPRSV